MKTIPENAWVVSKLFSLQSAHSPTPTTSAVLPSPLALQNVVTNNNDHTANVTSDFLRNSRLFIVIAFEVVV